MIQKTRLERILDLLSWKGGTHSQVTRMLQRNNLLDSASDIHSPDDDEFETLILLIGHFNSIGKLNTME